MRVAITTLAATQVAMLWAGSAWAGQVDGSVGVDYFHSSSRRDDPREPEIPRGLTAQDVGMRVRARLLELDDRLEVIVDYRGREAFGGQLADGVATNANHRLLYRGEVRYEILEDRLVAGAGRFVAPAAALLPVDGLRAEIRLLDGLTIEPWGGRRAISTSRRNVDFTDFLPAAGASVRWASPRLRAEVAGAFSRDEALLSPGGEEVTEEFDSANVFADVTYRPLDDLFVGGLVSFVQRAGYVLGPGWTTATIETEALDLFQGLLFADYRPFRWLRASYDLQYQRAAVFRAGTQQEVLTPDSAVDFLDNRFEVSVRALEIGWVRAKGRYRVRDDRHELRLGGSVDVDDLYVDGLYLRAWLLHEDIEFDDESRDLDRFLWSALIGYRGHGLDAQAGARFLDRSSLPVSSRGFVLPGQGDLPGVGEDLAPFVLEAQSIAFVRAFYTRGPWFAGLDFEHSLKDAELRVLVQVGAFLEEAW